MPVSFGIAGEGFAKLVQVFTDRSGDVADGDRTSGHTAVTAMKALENNPLPPENQTGSSHLSPGMELRVGKKYLHRLKMCLRHRP